jgi:hypothetical protein
MILSKLVLVVIFLLATAQVSAPIDADLQSVSQPISGVVLMLIAGFAPYLTYKAISFMGFDMYHAMSTEQEAKGALNRPMPIPLTHRGGAAEPPKILGGSSSGGGTSPATAPATRTPPPGTGGSVGGMSVPSGGSSGLATGAAVAKEAASAGPQVGNFVAATASGHAEAAQNQTPPSGPPHIADPTLIDRSKHTES